MTYDDAIAECFPGLEYKEIVDIKAKIPDCIKEILIKAHEISGLDLTLEEMIGLTIMFGIENRFQDGIKNKNSN